MVAVRSLGVGQVAVRSLGVDQVAVRSLGVGQVAVRKPSGLKGAWRLSKHFLDFCKRRDFEFSLSLSLWEMRE